MWIVPKIRAVPEIPRALQILEDQLIREALQIPGDQPIREGLWIREDRQIHVGPGLIESVGQEPGRDS